MKIDNIPEIISANYHFQVQEFTKLGEHSYRLETNFGPKRLSIWENRALLEWAFSWRERLAELGYRQIDRFIRNQSDNFHLEVEGTYLVVQDWFEGDGITLKSKEQYELFGQFVGNWYQACREATQHLNPLMKQQLAETLCEALEKPGESNQQLHVLKQKMATIPDSMFTYLIRQHWPSITKRYRQATLLEQASKASQREGIFPLSISLDQWRMTKDGYVVFQDFNHQASSDLRGIANLLQFFYTEKQAALTEIEAWYIGFCQAFQAEIHTHYHLLGQLIYPSQYLTILSSYLNQNQDEETCIEAWLTACQEQTRLDELHLWLAQYVDRGRQEQGLGS